MLDTTWIYDSSKNQWTKGPALIEKRHEHSCFFDKQSVSVFVTGGWGAKRRLKSTEKLKMNENLSWKSTTDLLEPLANSAAVASNSNQFIGYVAGGFTNNGQHTKKTDKIWGLRRTNLNWVEMPKRLRKSRSSHSIVNVASDEIPGCWRLWTFCIELCFSDNKWRLICYKVIWTVLKWKYYFKNFIFNNVMTHLIWLILIINFQLQITQFR